MGNLISYIVGLFRPAILDSPPVPDRFQLADRDGDGRITRDEFEQTYVNATGAPPPSHAWKTFDAADGDGDDALNVDEFLEGRKLRGATKGE